jgi:hypothetical protein
MDNYKVKLWDNSGKPLFSIKEADPKKLKKMLDKVIKEKLM